MWRGTKHSPEKIMVDQPESLNKWKSKGHRLKGKGIKAAQAVSVKRKVQFQSKEMKTDSDGVHDKK